MSDPGAFAVAGAEEQDGGEPPPLAGAGVVVCLMGRGLRLVQSVFRRVAVIGLRTTTRGWTIYELGWQFLNSVAAR